ncbi:MAG: TIGR03790 family protein [Akkermansiaceae bacterium]|nr:TIGR03790 family protein [Akkermansiaceae bacterium]
MSRLASTQKRRIIRIMKLSLLTLMLWTICIISLSATIPPEAVAILYNTKTPESLKLAEMYREARHIPQENLIGLELPVTADISRDNYEQKIAKPLRAEFEKRNWWKRQKDSSGMVGPVENKIRVLVLMRGVPLRIQPQAIANPKNHPVDDHNEASVDSELAMFGVETTPINGVMQNKFYQSEKPITQAGLPFLILTARIDGPSFTTCERMIRDALETEKNGLWGMAYVDIANKIPEGDQWLENVVKANGPAGIPTVVDRFNDTLPKNYPMLDAAYYYGWYDWHVSGPFLNPKFRFRKGAVAMHLHSFSADQLTDATKNWSAPLLEKGATVTIGNVYEPYLGLTHHFGIIHQKLLEGNSWVEACWMAMPVVSWQGVVLGDPLYRPCLHLGGTGVKQENDVAFRAIRAAAVEWENDPKERQKQLEKAAERMQSGVLAEAIGLDLLGKKSAAASQWFLKAKVFYPKLEDQLRQDFHMIGNDRFAQRIDLTISGLRDAQTRYSSLPEAEALKGWLDILLPPPAPAK